MLGWNPLSTLASFTSGSDGLVDWSKLAIGAVGGAVGTLAMKYYWKGATSLHGGDRREETRTLQDDLEPIEVLESHGSDSAERSDRPGRTSYPAMGSGGSTGGGLRTAGSAGTSGTTSSPGTETVEQQRETRRRTRPNRRYRDAFPIIRPEPRWRPNESSTEALARMTYEKLRGYEPTETTKRRLGGVLDWAYSLENGATYGALRAGRHELDLAGGAALGTFTWLFNNELGAPLVGLAPGPQRSPIKQHLHRLGAHLAFGLTTAAVTQALWSMVSD